MIKGRDFYGPGIAGPNGEVAKIPYCEPVTPKVCKSCGLEGHVRRTSKKCLKNPSNRIFIGEFKHGARGAIVSMLVLTDL